MNPQGSNQLNSDDLPQFHETINPNGSKHGDESEDANQVTKVSMTNIYVVFLADGSVSHTPIQGNGKCARLETSRLSQKDVR